ncbi:MAG: hypothetical protein JSV86_12195 [Gemmatimonadota bacterium]|nr:MAG: hypothetical protein JSV86_12195 [Gemmatimonadota bacterium]
MSMSADTRCLLRTLLLLALAGCTAGERAAQEGEAAAPAAEGTAAEETARVPVEAAPAVESEPREPAVREETAQPGTAPPATEGETETMRPWVLLEFARPLEETDFGWLEANGFRVDTVMSERLVRGWLGGPAGGAVIASDPRIARIHTQMR